jgi:hypothetical protein
VSSEFFLARDLLSFDFQGDGHNPPSSPFTIGGDIYFPPLDKGGIKGELKQSRALVAEGFSLRSFKGRNLKVATAGKTQRAFESSSASPFYSSICFFQDWSFLS